MAEKASKSEKKTQALTRDRLVQIASEADRQRDLAAEYQGQHGGVIRNAVEQYGLDRKAFGFTRAVLKMEAVKQRATIAASLEYLEWLGAFDQIDAFDDLVDRLDGLLTRIRGRNGKTPPPKTAGTLEEIAASKPH